MSTLTTNHAHARRAAVAALATEIAPGPPIKYRQPYRLGFIALSILMALFTVAVLALVFLVTFWLYAPTS